MFQYQFNHTEASIFRAMPEYALRQIHG